jgi:hypothetical protein
MPEQGDPKIFYKLAPLLKDKLYVCITFLPTALFSLLNNIVNNSFELLYKEMK